MTAARGAAVVTVLLAFAMPRAARASDTALAEQLYELGRKLMAEGHVSQACPRFAESQRLDPATGTLLNLATCHEAEGKLATAWAEFKTAETAARRDGREDREQFARQHLATIEPRLSRVTIAVPEASRAPDLEVRLDGNVLGPASWGVAAPLDPGTHEVVARARGRKPFSARVTVTTFARQTVTVELEPLEAEPAVSAVAPAPRVVVSAPGGEPEADSGRVAGYVVGGVAVVALAAGAGFGLSAKLKWDARNGRCDKDDVCTDQGIAYGNQADTAATLSNVAFVVGALGAVTAGYLLFIRPGAAAASTTSRLRLTPGASARAGGLMLSGAW